VCVCVCVIIHATSYKILYYAYRRHKKTCERIFSTDENTWARLAILSQFHKQVLY